MFGDIVVLLFWVIIMNIGQRIKEARLEKGLSQAQLAEKCGFATITIQQYERNKREPKLENLQKIADALDMSVIAFLDFAPESATNEEKERWRVIQEIYKKIISYQEEGKTIRIIDGGIYSVEENISTLEEKLKAAFRSLNAPGQQKAVERVEELTEIPKYQRSGSPAAPQPHGRDTATPAPETPSERKETPPQAEAQDGVRNKK